MPRIPYPKIDELHPTVQEAFNALPTKLNIFRMFAHAERNFTALIRLGGTILGRQKLDAKLRELAILRVARLSKAEYEWVQHVPIAIRAGATEAQVKAIETGETHADCFDDEEKLVLDFTDDSLHNVRPSDDTMARMNAHFSPQETMELVVAIGFYMLVARIMETSGLDMEAPAGDDIVAALE